MNYKIHILDLNFQGRANSIASFLIETESGPLLIETGPHSTLENLKKGIENTGYRIEDVRHVFITHIHFDHAGAAWCLSRHGAQIYLHPQGYRHMHDPSRLLASAKRIYKETMDSLWGTLEAIPADQMVIVEDDQIIDVNGIAIKAIHSPGHAKHHIAWQLDNFLFTGDVAGVRIHQGPVIPPCPPPDIDLELWIASIEKIRRIEQVDTYFLTHFGQITDLDHHNSTLVKTLSDYSQYIKPFAEKGLESEEIIPQFKQFAKNYLIQHGMNPKDAEIYETANPSDMSVGGLMRYWHKRLDSGK